MRKLNVIIMILVAVFIPLVLFAEELVEIQIEEFIGHLVTSIGGIQGATAMGIALIVVQTLMMLGKTFVGKYAGKHRLLIVYGLSVATGVLSLMVVGDLNVFAALLHSQTLAAYQVFGHQAIKQFTKKEESKEKPEEKKA